MANYSTSWPLPPSFSPRDPSTNVSMHLEQHNKQVKAPMTNGQDGDDGVLHVTIHHARDIHNICIYGNQDVYAKFSLSHCEDAVYVTQPVKAGGQNPVFKQTLEIPISEQDSILRCELWMMSCARNYLEDQLLGFVLLPLKSLSGKGELTHECCLTSTDLFYTPAGTVCLSLAFSGHGSNGVARKMFLQGNNSLGPSSPSSHEAVMEYGEDSENAARLSKVEFLDLEAASEEQHLVAMYYKLAAAGNFQECGDSNVLPVHGDTEIGYAGHGDCGLASGSEQEISKAALVVHVPTKPTGSVDHDMVRSPEEDQCTDGSPCLSGLSSQSALHDMSLSSTANPAMDHIPTATQPSASSIEGECKCSCSPMPLNKTEGKEIGLLMPQSSVPLVSLSVEPEVAINQEHFVDLYLKSMQQFTDKLADMKFSFDIESQDIAALRSVQVNKEFMEGRKKEGSKLYYGSRAFY